MIKKRTEKKKDETKREENVKVVKMKAEIEEKERREIRRT